MDDIPFEERRVIGELVGLWHTRYEPSDLATHIDRVSWGNRMAARFFQHVYEDLHADKRSYYPAASASEFQRFLEAEYRLLPKPKIGEREEYERRTREEREERERRARADFVALGVEMDSAITREKLVELGRQRAVLAPYTGIRYVYTNHCWNCGGPISSEVHARCPSCRFYICTCGSCLCGRIVVYDEPYLPDFPDDAS